MSVLRKSCFTVGVLWLHTLFIYAAMLPPRVAME